MEITNIQIKQNIAIAAGGTGGHIFPAEAVCEVLTKRYNIIWFTDERGVKFIKPLPEYNIVTLPVRSIGSNLKASYNLLLMAISVMKSMYLLQKNKVKVVIGFGGYPAAPVMLAAILLRISIVIHEQNAVMGRVNRLFAKFAKVVFTSFENTIHSTDKAIYVGNPVRQSIINATKTFQKTKKANEITILIIGGSQGSNLISNIALLAINNMPEDLRARLSIIQQVRTEIIDQVRNSYSKVGNLIIQDFFEDIGSKMMESDIIIARSGASTVAEISYVQKPSILIPLVYAKDNHQYYNAKYLADQNAAILLEEKNFTPSSLKSIIESMIMNIDLLNKNAQKIPQNINCLAKIVTKINQLII